MSVSGLIDASNLLWSHSRKMLFIFPKIVILLRLETGSLYLAALYHEQALEEPQLRLACWHAEVCLDKHYKPHSRSFTLQIEDLG